MKQEFVVTFRAQHDDGVRALRGLLKVALRRFGLRAVTIEESKPEGLKTVKHHKGEETP
jgi:hypothetical protein